MAAITGSFMRRGKSVGLVHRAPLILTMLEVVARPAWTIEKDAGESDACAPEAREAPPVMEPWSSVLLAAD